MGAEERVYLPDAEATHQLGLKLAKQLTGGEIIYLRGPLGAGKTALAKAILQGLGYLGAVKSPTYTLLEPYEFCNLVVYHFDLYRLTDPEELEFLGIRDYFDKQSVAIIEWPERGMGWLPQPTVDIELFLLAKGREVCIR